MELMSKHVLTAQIMARLNSLEQTPPTGEGELTICKNDPKNGQDDHWCAFYGKVHLSGYYSLRQLLVDFDHEVSKAGYYDEVK